MRSTPIYEVHAGSWQRGADGAFTDPSMGATLSRTSKLVDSLAQLNLTPADIEFVSFSHAHADHTGNGNLFANSTWIVDADERAYMFRPEARADASLPHQVSPMNKVYPDAKSALDGILKDGMMIMSGGFGLCGIAETLSDAAHDVPLSATPTGAMLQITEANIAFGTVQATKSAGKPITVTNTGNVATTVTFTLGSANTALTFANAQTSLVDWLTSGNLVRFPRLKIVYSEAQIGWMPFVLDRLDKVWEHAEYAGLDPIITEPPSSYVPGRIYGSFFDDDCGIEQRDRIGVTQLVLAGMIIYAIPLIDTTLAIVRRKMAGKSISSADSDHLHHMLKRAYGVKKAVLIMYGIAAAFAIISRALSSLICKIIASR